MSQRLGDLLVKEKVITPEQLEQAHAYVYGGCIHQDMGYYPFSSKLFSDLTHYVRSGDYVVALIRESQDLDEYADAVAEKVRVRFGPYGAIGENIMMERDPARAFEPGAFARRAVQGWMNSEGHRANIQVMGMLEDDGRGSCWS